MGRLPFDPSKMTSRPGPERAGDVLTVSQVASRIDGAIRAGIPSTLRFTGEVSGFRERTHWYFDLKDADAVVGCVVFASVARKCGFTPIVGQQVVVRGRVEFYAKAGKVSVIIEQIEPAGAGALELKLRALVEELRGLGYLDPARKRRLPMLPRKIAAVTSRSGAALQDVLETMRRRCPGVGVVLVDVRVQGEGAHKDIADAIREVSRRCEELGVDALLLTRGGGSMEDLWCFNEREVADAIVACRVPVVAAIGHETDTTVAELVADERASTPTQAAMRLTPDATALLRQLNSTGARLASALGRGLRLDQQRASAISEGLDRSIRDSLSLAHRRLDSLLVRLQRQQPREVHARLLDRLARAEAALHSAVRHRLDRATVAPIEAALRRALPAELRRHHLRLDAAERQLQAVGPLRVLARGYSITTTPDGRVVRSPSDAPPRTRVHTRVEQGEFQSEVLGEAPPAPKPAPTPERRHSGTTPPTSPGLFG